MPTNRAGDKTATQSPSVAPNPEVAITQALPADGDPPNASTYAQPYKVVADFIDWLMKPQAKLSQWAQWIFGFRAANGHKRFIIDHFGLPGGRLQEWREGWAIGGGLSAVAGSIGPADLNVDAFTDVWTAIEAMGNDLALAAAAANLADCQTNLANAGNNAVLVGTKFRHMQGMSPWRAHAVKTTGTSSVQVLTPSSSPTNRHRSVGILAGDTLNDYAILYRLGNTHFDDDLTQVYEFELQLESATMGSKLVVEAGLCEENAVPASYGTAQNFITFEKIISGNWFVRTAAGGVVTAVDTGVAATTNWTRFRIELAGANASDNGVRAVRFYINGAQVGGDVITNLPAVTATVSPHFSVTNYQGGAHGLGSPVRVGPVHFASNIYGADVS